MPKKTKSSSFQSTGGVLITERADDSCKLQERIEALLEEQDISCNSTVQFGLYLTSMIPPIHDSILVDFLDKSHRLFLSEIILMNTLTDVRELKKNCNQSYLINKCKNVN